MVYSFARIGAALAMKVEDVFTQNRRLWVRLHEKGGKRHELPCHHNLETTSISIEQALPPIPRPPSSAPSAAMAAAQVLFPRPVSANARRTS
jgi:hypothetical protein